MGCLQVLFRRVAASTVLGASARVDGLDSARLPVYAFCSAEHKGGVTALVINLDETEAAEHNSIRVAPGLTCHASWHDYCHDLYAMLCYCMLRPLRSISRCARPTAVRRSGSTT